MWIQFIRNQRHNSPCMACMDFAIVKQIINFFKQYNCDFLLSQFDHSIRSVFTNMYYPRKHALSRSRSSHRSLICHINQFTFSQLSIGRLETLTVFGNNQTIYYYSREKKQSLVSALFHQMLLIVRLLMILDVGRSCVQS